MINKSIAWIKNNKFTFILLVIVSFFIFRGFVNSLFGASAVPGYSVSSVGFGNRALQDEMMEYGMGESNYKSAPAPVSPEAAPQPDITDRKMITSSNISLQVLNVTQTIEDIKWKLNEVKGWVTNVNISRPEFGESANVQVRVPTSEVDNLISFLREKSIKVASETISGTDITDQYVDIEERLERLEKTKARFVEISDEAKDVDEILRVQREINNLQNQIDSYKGQLNYMDGASKTSLITVYLSTDEEGLPYAPPTSWRPEVIFKYAVRSLIGTLQKIGSLLIWLGVYSVLILPAATIVIIIVQLKKRKQDNNKKYETPTLK